MLCHVRSASPRRKHRIPSLMVSWPRIVAKFDMRNQVERDTQAFLKRACSGRWPMWRLLGMKRHGDTLFVSVEWCHSPRYLIPNGTGQCDRSQTGQCDRPRLAQWDLEFRGRPVVELTK